MRQGRKLWVLLVALATTAIMSAPAFAEVQNVKVGGDITVRGIWRANFDLSHDGNFTTNGLAALTDSTGATDTTDAEKFIFSSIGINLTADLTDNVSTDIRLINQRDWGADGAGTNNDVKIARAYVTMKEMLYSPLTVRIGRQPLWFGKGFIVGSRLLAGDTNPNADFSATEFTDQTGFDAIRATLDYNPVTVDLVYAKIVEGLAASDGDINLTGVNLGWKGSSMSSEAEVYYWNKYDASTRAITTGGGAGSMDANAGNVHTIGLRGSLEPIAHTSLWGEFAWQFGNQSGAVFTGRNSTSQNAVAFDFGADYTMADVAWTPKVGGEWIYYSGGSIGSPAGWDPIYRGKFDSLIREFQGATVGTSIYPTDQPLDTNSSTNEAQFALFAAAKPTDSIKWDGRLTWFVAPTALNINGNATSDDDRRRFLGTEVDNKLTYDYTEDVQIGLIYGVFWPGTVYRNRPAAVGSRTSLGGRAIAQELVSTVSVKF